MTEIIIDTNKVIKRIPNFYNNIHFHPTDAIEDEWGQNILSTIDKDKAIRCVRIYTMFEDMVTTDSDGTLRYDFRLNDKRMDTLVGYGFKLIVTYCFMPVCMSSRPDVAIEKYRYKGKGYNSYEPSDYKKWKKLCADYTEHIVNRYGAETVGKWYLECWNEPDAQYWMKDEPPEVKIKAYLKLYRYFAEGIKSVNPELRTGGPASCGGLPHSIQLVEELVKLSKSGISLDFISYHTYAISPDELNSGIDPDLMLNIDKIKRVNDVLVKHNCIIPIIIDEWESVWGGPTGISKVPRMAYRDSEYFAAAYAKMIDLCIKYLILKDVPLEMIMLCLSGQHDLKKDFEGKRNFITKSGYKKPIYGAYVLTNRLGDELLEYDVVKSNKHLGIIPTKGDCLKILTYYMSEELHEDLMDLDVIIEIPGMTEDFKYDRLLIDKDNYNSLSRRELLPDNLKMITNTVKIKVFHEKAASQSITLTLKQNTVCLLEIEN